MIAGVNLYQTLSPLVDGRVFPNIVREHDSKEKPFIIYSIVSTLPEVTLDGVTGHEWVNVQVDVYHADLYSCTLLANKVISAINDNIKPSIYGGQDSLYDTQAKLYRIKIDYEFWQTNPTD